MVLSFSRGVQIAMATKIKGIFKGIKYISQIFVYKEHHEMEIGYPTDVRHVAHIGWDGSGTSVNAPSWMSEIRSASDFSSTELSNLGQDPNSRAVASWSSQDFQQSMGIHPVSAIFADSPNSELPKVPKKTKQKKTKVSSPTSSSSSSRSFMRTSKSKGSFTADEEGSESQFGII
ncbi:CRIB domain-containing protein RIC10-like protein isoform X2 [Cinnamomum micranthum f. kanehirae]|uniref:CRIB domain-containing protein RIC10-like protein isoform X2 n=1 Tax=Cinnamomum micranthum f. kanehirae TaxID=337451 RepID=A0A443PC80_9MAGN|nr:CRIB domain-containing protein RIC10-like protein isoform X2 [Cinnamomum micranthum f. kanehirae]